MQYKWHLVLIYVELFRVQPLEAVIAYVSMQRLRAQVLTCRRVHLRVITSCCFTLFVDFVEVYSVDGTLLAETCSGSRRQWTTTAYLISVLQIL